MSAQRVPSEPETSTVIYPPPRSSSLPWPGMGSESSPSLPLSTMASSGQASTRISTAPVPSAVATSPSQNTSPKSLASSHSTSSGTSKKFLGIPIFFSRNRSKSKLPMHDPPDSSNQPPRRSKSFPVLNGRHATSPPSTTIPVHVPSSAASSNREGWKPPVSTTLQRRPAVRAVSPPSPSSSIFEADTREAAKDHLRVFVDRLTDVDQEPYRDSTGPRASFGSVQGAESNSNSSHDTLRPPRPPPKDSQYSTDPSSGAPQRSHTTPPKPLPKDSQSVITVPHSEAPRRSQTS
ncbi:hypothetical protein BCR39DRAFT_79474 [Naematelia encephala]|uniref:Uncharacterized protein n=1 Tax=Naematelia encephala TaxID=71784 RepID=A0A1Y2BA92_9TREE|nr:hypothetical protein BCR39DRAFT_79474 [Naematelia encephala]